MFYIDSSVHVFYQLSRILTWEEPNCFFVVVIVLRLTFVTISSQEVNITENIFCEDQTTGALGKFKSVLLYFEFVFNQPFEIYLTGIIHFFILEFETSLTIFCAFVLSSLYSPDYRLVIKWFKHVQLLNGGLKTGLIFIVTIPRLVLQQLLT